MSLCERPARDFGAPSLGASPYIVGNPVDRAEMLFGRDELLERLQRQLGGPDGGNVVLLEGNRRAGKTSILRRLLRQDLLPGWLAVYCSFQEAEGTPGLPGVSTRNIFRLLARAMGWQLHDAGIPTWVPGEDAQPPGRPFKLAFRQALDRAFRNEQPFETFALYLEATLEAVRPRRLLLMLDEFDKLQEGIDSGVTSQQVPENLRHLLQHARGLSAILSGSRRMRRLREEYWSALFGLGHRLGVGPLAEEQARRLVTVPVQGRLGYSPEAVARVVALCARHPFLLQSLGNRIFDSAASSGERTVTLAAVEAAAAEMVQDNEHFRTMWDYAGTHRRRLLLGLCEKLSGGAEAVTLDVLAGGLEALGLTLERRSVLADDVEVLRELELLEFVPAPSRGSYRVAVPLLGLWLRTSIDLDDAAMRAREEAGGALP